MRGILISVALHTLVLLAAALGLPWLAKPPAQAARNFEVDIVRLSDITQASKGEKPKPRTERKPDAERETTEKPVARDRRAGKPPEKPEPVKPKPAEVEPPKVAEPKPQPKPKPPEKTATAKPKAPPKPEPPKKAAVAKPEAAPAPPPKPAKKAEPAPKPKAAPPKRAEIDPRALQRRTDKPKKQASAKKPDPPAPKPAPKPVAKPEKKVVAKPETRIAKPAPKPGKKPEKKTAALKKPAPPPARPKKKPEPEPREKAKKAAPKKPAKPEAKVAKPKKKPEPKPPETARKAEPKVERQVAALPRPRPPAQPRPERKAKQPPKAVKKPPARKDPLDSVFKTVGKLKQSQQSDRDRTAGRTPAGVKTAARSLRLTLSEIQAIRRQLQPCWHFPVDAQDAGSLRVRITIWLNRDGSVRDAKILDGADTSRNAKLRAAADAGIRAVNNPRCSPLKLPPEKFDQWKVLTIDFDPSKLKSG
ncbi:MAG: hypothetical protein F4114_15370 [Rhodospirillaceae bacterium]|nr:hypothetical protein [Rhodospirillaceae bacterium]